MGTLYLLSLVDKKLRSSEAGGRFGFLLDSLDARGMCVKEIRVGKNISPLCPLKVRDGSTVKGKFGVDIFPSQSGI